MTRLNLLTLVLLGLCGCILVQWEPPPLGKIPIPPPPKGSIERSAVDEFGDDTEPAAGSELIARRVLFGNPRKAAPKISPDGKRLAFLAPDQGVLNVWVAPAGDVAAAKVVTKDRKRGIRRFFWAYTNEHVIYLQDKGGDENWRAYSVELSSGKEVDLTPLDGVRAQIQQVSHKLPGEILVGLNDRDKKYHDIHRVDIRSGKRQLIQQNDGYGGFVTDDDYAIRFAIKPMPDGGERILRKRGRRFGPYMNISMEDALTTGIVGFDASGKQLYMYDSRGRNTAAFTTVKLPGRKAKVVSHDVKADVSDVTIHPTSRKVQAVASTYLRKKWVFFDKAVEQDFAQLQKVTRGEVEVISRTLDDKIWTVSFETDNGPARYYLYDRASNKASFLFTNRPDLEGLKLGKMRPLEIKSRDGLTLVSYLTLPASVQGDRPAKPLPMVLFVHGGPWARDHWGFHRWHQWLANRGYAVLSVNYRGSTGFGKAFINAGNGEWAGKMHDDLIDAVNWAIAQQIAAADQVAIMGGSYGGYATLVGLTFTPKRFACGVDIVGPSNIVTLFESIPPYWAPFMATFKKRVGDHETKAGRKDLLARSPLSFVDRIHKPLLIGQGANDPRVKQAESDQIVKAMQAKKIPVTYVLYPDEGHGFRRPENNMSFNAVAEAFLARCLGGKAQPIGDDFKGASIQVPAGAQDVPGLAEALKK